MKQGQVFIVGQASVTEETPEQPDLNGLPPMVWNGKVKINSLFGQNVMTAGDTGDMPTSSLEGFEVTFGFSAGQAGHQGT